MFTVTFYELAFLNTQLAVLAKSFGEGIVVDFQLSHAFILSSERECNSSCTR